MTDAGLRLLAMALAIGLGAIGPGAGTYMFLGFALTETLFIFALVFGMLIGFGIL